MYASSGIFRNIAHYMEAPVAIRVPSALNAPARHCALCDVT